MPDYTNAEYDIEKAFRAIEDELIASMMRNLDGHRAEETDLGYNWTQWQVEQLKALEKYKKENAKKFSSQISDITGQIKMMLHEARIQGETDQEQNILRAIRNGFQAKKIPKQGIEGTFFRLNTRKLEALQKATTQDIQKASYAMLRMANDKYRQIIYNAQVYATTGAGTYEKAVDMATKDFLRSGINCIEYRNGSRHTVKEYAKMAIQTANKRAYLTGEGEMRKAWGVDTVILNKRGNACPKCLPFVGKILIDDVWSGGKPDGKHRLMSQAIAAGLYHPNCKDSHTTYFSELEEESKATYTKKELQQIQKDYRQDQQQQYAKRQAEKFDRLEKYSLDSDNKRVYGARKEEWENFSNKAKIIDAITTEDYNPIYKKEDIIEELNESIIGKETIEAIEKSNVRIELINTPRYDGVRGDQWKNEIRLFSDNCASRRIIGQTLIHEMAHYRFGIGNCQYAEAVCFAMEKMHIMKRNYLTLEEWEYVKKLAIDNYPEYNWIEGGYGDYDQFQFVKYDD